jgi:spermidine/putrescine transport system substrate-binding protein
MPAPGSPGKSTLALATWEDYAPAELVERFERDTGIKVTVTTIASNRDLVTKLKARTPLDLVQPTVTRIPAAVQDDLLQPIEPDRLKHAGRLRAGMVRAADESGALVRGRRYGLPFAWGAEGLVYDRTRLTPPPDSWGALHDEAYAGRVTYRATFHAFVATGLWMDVGNRMRDLYTSEEDARGVLSVVLERLIESKPQVRRYWSTVEEVEGWLADGEVDLAQGWDGTAWELARRGKPIAFAAPAEGALAWMDGFAIPKGAKQVDAAYAWIDFMCDPRNAAAFTGETGYATAVDGATALLEPAHRTELEAAFPPAAVEHLWWFGIEHSWWHAVVAEYVGRLRKA